MDKKTTVHNLKCKVQKFCDAHNLLNRTPFLDSAKA